MPGSVGKFTDAVNGKLTVRLGTAERSIYRPMAQNGLLKRILHRVEAVGTTVAAAGKAAGMTDSTVRNLQRGRSGDMRAGTLAALAGPLKTTPAWLAYQYGPEVAEIPIWGRAGAGAEVINFHENDQPIGTMEAPADANANTAAVEIVGNSLGALFDSWRAVYDEVRRPPTDDLIGRLCVVGLTDGRVYIKRLRRSGGNKYSLESNTGRPIRNVTIEWAAPIKCLVPRY